MGVVKCCSAGGWCSARPDGALHCFAPPGWCIRFSRVFAAFLVAPNGWCILVHCTGALVHGFAMCVMVALLCFRGLLSISLHCKWCSECWYRGQPEVAVVCLCMCMSQHRVFVLVEVHSLTRCSLRKTMPSCRSSHLRPGPGCWSTGSRS